MPFVVARTLSFVFGPGVGEAFLTVWLLIIIVYVLVWLIKAIIPKGEGPAPRDWTDDGSNDAAAARWFKENHEKNDEHKDLRR